MGAVAFCICYAGLFLTAAAVLNETGLLVEEARVIAQKMAKIIEHDALYLEQAAKFLQILQMENCSEMEILLQNRFATGVREYS